MMKSLAFAILLAFSVPLGGCGALGIGSPPTAPAPGVVSEGQKTLHIAETGYNGALKAILVLVNNKILKGAKAEAVRKAVLTTKAAIDVARASVDAGAVDLSAIFLASGKVIELLALYKQ